MLREVDDSGLSPVAFTTTATQFCLSTVQNHRDSKQEWQQKHKHQHDKKFNWVNYSNLQQYYSDKTRIGSSLCIQQTLQV